MKIEAASKSGDVSLSGRDEVWVHVYANAMHDWPSVEAKLTGPQRVMLNGLGTQRKLAYFPHTPNAEERAEHGFTFEDHWVWSSK